MNKTLFAILAMALSSFAVASGDSEAGKVKAQALTCNACHGENGIAINALYPNIAGQNEAYLASSMKTYRERQRTGGLAAVMYPMSANLTDEDIADLAAWFASLPATPIEAEPEEQ